MRNLSLREAESGCKGLPRSQASQPCEACCLRDSLDSLYTPLRKCNMNYMVFKAGSSQLISTSEDTACTFASCRRPDP